jgi:quinol monooxygenase YgiN
MFADRFIVFAGCLISSVLLVMCSGKTSTTEGTNELVRLAVIEVDSLQVRFYNEYLEEEIEASIRLEPGVVTLYGVAEKDKPQHVTLFETYADSGQYRSHLATPHFKKYKQGTLQMVKQLELIQMEPILYHRKGELSNTRSEDLYVRLIKIVLDSIAVGTFNTLGNSLMLPGIKEEPGVLVMYAVTEKENPTRVSILEVYKNMNAYNKHITTSHYLQYKDETKAMVKSLKFIDVVPIRLGSKPQ